MEISQSHFLTTNSSKKIFLVSLSVLVWLQRYLVLRVPEVEYAVLALVYPLLFYVGLIKATVSSGLGRYVIEAHAQGDDRKVTQIVSTMLPLTLATGLLIFLIGTLLAWNIDHVLNLAPEYVGDARLMFFLLILPPSIGTVLHPFMLGLEVKQKFLYMNVLALSMDVLRTAILFALLFGVSTRVLWVAVAATPPAFISLAIVFIASRRLVPTLRFRWREINRKHVRPIVSFGGWTLLGMSSAIIRGMAAPILLNHLSTPAQVGGYRLGSYVETKFYPMMLAPLVTVHPALTAMHATGQDERLQRYYFRMSRYVLWVSLFFAIPAFRGI